MGFIKNKLLEEAEKAKQAQLVAAQQQAEREAAEKEAAEQREREAAERQGREQASAALLLDGACACLLAG